MSSFFSFFWFPRQGLYFIISPSQCRGFTEKNCGPLASLPLTSGSSSIQPFPGARGRCGGAVRSQLGWHQARLLLFAKTEAEQQHRSEVLCLSRAVTSAGDLSSLGLDFTVCEMGSLLGSPSVSV